ncbi:MAG: VOC family protein [Pirellulaceae bacterium]
MNQPDSKPCRIDQVYPYLRMRDATAAIEFYKRVFGAEEIFRLTEPGGRIGHAELQFGPVVVMVSDEYPEMGILGPPSPGGGGLGIHLHVDDVDSLTQRAVDAGATLTMAPTDQFYGERSAKIVDPFGHEWMLGQHLEDVSPEEMQRRFSAMFPG